MRSLILLIVLIFPCSTTGQEKPKYVNIPHRNVLVLVASQPDCPIRIEETGFFLRVDNPGILITYRVRNISNKPIRVFTVLEQNSSGSGSTLVNPTMTSNRLLLPNQVLESKKMSEYEVIPITPAIKDKLKQDGEMKTLYILIVEKVLFMDGSVYRDTQTADALAEFFQAHNK